MTIETLKQMMPPPAKPAHAGSEGEWNAFQRKVGLRFPKDYYIVATTYGSGRFLAGELKIANPFDPDDEEFASFELTRLREIRQGYPDEVPYSLFPESGGLYPFAIDGNGNTFLWITEGPADEWPIVCLNSEDYSEVANHSLIDFLVLLASNDLNINRRKFWGSDFSDDHLEFVARRLDC